MMYKVQKLSIALFIAINESKWDEANELVIELQAVLKTYKESC